MHHQYVFEKKKSSNIFENHLHYVCVRGCVCVYFQVRKAYERRYGKTRGVVSSTVFSSVSNTASGKGGNSKASGKSRSISGSSKNKSNDTVALCRKGSDISNGMVMINIVYGYIHIKGEVHPDFKVFFFNRSIQMRRKCQRKFKQIPINSKKRFNLYICDQSKLIKKLIENVPSRKFPS